MQSIKWYDHEKAYQRIMSIMKFKTQADLAKLIGRRQSTISGALIRKRIPELWLVILTIKAGINPQWVLYGTGEPYLVPSSEGFIGEGSAMAAGMPHDEFTIDCPQGCIILIRKK